MVFKNAANKQNSNNNNKKHDEIRGFSNKTNNILCYGHDTFHNSILPCITICIDVPISEFLSIY